MAYAKKPTSKKSASKKSTKPFVPFWAMKKGAKAKGKSKAKK